MCKTTSQKYYHLGKRHVWHHRQSQQLYFVSCNRLTNFTQHRKRSIKRSTFNRRPQLCGTPPLIGCGCIKYLIHQKVGRHRQGHTPQTPIMEVRRCDQNCMRCHGGLAIVIRLAIDPALNQLEAMFVQRNLQTKNCTLGMPPRWGYCSVTSWSFVFFFLASWYSSPLFTMLLTIIAPFGRVIRRSDEYETV